MAVMSRRRRRSSRNICYRRGLPERTCCPQRRLPWSIFCSIHQNQEQETIFDNFIFLRRCILLIISLLPFLSNDYGPTDTVFGRDGGCHALDYTAFRKTGADKNAASTTTTGYFKSGGNNSDGNDNGNGTTQQRRNFRIMGKEEHHTLREEQRELQERPSTDGDNIFLHYENIVRPIREQENSTASTGGGSGGDLSAGAIVVRPSIGFDEVFNQDPRREPATTYIGDASTVARPQESFFTAFPTTMPIVLPIPTSTVITTEPPQPLAGGGGGNNITGNATDDLLTDEDEDNVPLLDEDPVTPSTSGNVTAEPPSQAPSEEPGGIINTTPISAPPSMIVVADVVTLSPSESFVDGSGSNNDTAATPVAAEVVLATSATAKPSTQSLRRERLQRKRRNGNRSGGDNDTTDGISVISSYRERLRLKRQSSREAGNRNADKGESTLELVKGS